MSETARRVRSMCDLEHDTICYWMGDDEWWLYLPGCGVGRLTNHDVEEHEDGTISVTPSILVTGHNHGEQSQRHGYLTKGVWNEC
jgi:hypothetical protein